MDLLRFQTGLGIISLVSNSDSDNLKPRAPIARNSLSLMTLIYSFAAPLLNWDYHRGGEKGSKGKVNREETRD